MIHRNFFSDNARVAKSRITIDRKNFIKSIRYILILVLILTFCFFYGAAFAFFAPYMASFFALPLVIIAGLLIWALPDSGNGPSSAVIMLFYAFVIALVMWPNYLAVTIHGLPWLTVIRIIGFPLSACFLLCISISLKFKRTITLLLSSNRTILILICTFVALQLFSIFMSHNKASSIQKFIVAQMEWTSIFFTSIYFFSVPGRMEKWAKTLWVLAIIVGIIGLWQLKLHKLPWAGHIPAFLSIDDEAVQRIFSGGGRAYTNGYRIQSTFGTPLGLSEYIAITIPFVLYFGLHGQTFGTRAAAIISIPFLILTVVLTDSRLGMVGCFLTLLIYPLTEGLRLWRRNKSSIIGPAIVLAYPVAFVAAIAATFTVGKLRKHIWGGGAQQASTNSRFEQYQLGIPKIFHNPFGYGIGQGGETLGYAPFGFQTIDTYYLVIALEYGVAGFIIYYSLIAYCIYKAANFGLVEPAEDRERGQLIPIAISLFSFMVIKSVFSQQDNHPLVFMMMGAIVAITGRLTSSTSDVEMAVTVSHQRNSFSRGSRPRRALPGPLS